MSKIKNTNIILLNIINNKEFFDKLDLELIKEISLVSKLVREKLKPLLFYSVQLDEKINFENNIFVEYINNKNGSIIVHNNIREDKNISIENGLNDITSAFKGVSRFTESLYLSCLQRAGYYIFSIINSFNNLSVLKLKSCFIPYSGFIKLGELLPNLTKLSLHLVILTSLPTEDTSPNDCILPSNLTRLEITSCDVTNTSLLSDPYDFLFTRNLQFTYEEFKLPTISVPLLKNLIFLGYYNNDGGLSNFLKLNTNLESLFTESFNLEMINGLKCLKCLEIDNIYDFDNNFSIPTPTLESIIELKVNYIYPEYYENFKQLCSYCPNLEYLYIGIPSINNVRQTIDNFLVPITSSLSKLKTLKLYIVTNLEVILDFSKITQIEKLIIKTQIKTLLNINFKNCNNLKKIEFNSIKGSINIEEIREKFNNYKNWIFKYYEGRIVGYKLNKK